MKRELARLLKELEELRWADGIKSPYVKGGNITNRGNHYYHCNKTNRVFNVLSRTYLANRTRSIEKYDKFLDLLFEGADDERIMKETGLKIVTLYKYYVILGLACNLEKVKPRFFNMHIVKYLQGKEKRVIYKRLLGVL